MYFITEKKGGKKKRRHIRHKRKEGSSAWYAKAFFFPRRTALCRAEPAHRLLDDRQRHPVGRHIKKKKKNYLVKTQYKRVNAKRLRAHAEDD